MTASRAQSSSPTAACDERRPGRPAAPNTLRLMHPETSGATAKCEAAGPTRRPSLPPGSSRGEDRSDERHRSASRSPFRCTSRYAPSLRPEAHLHLAVSPLRERPFMTSWVITIDRDHPQHWGIAKRHGFWDMTKAYPIRHGDLIYFWQAGASLVSRCRATASAYPIGRGHRTPWLDGGLRTYRSRVDFTVLSERPKVQPKWGDLQDQMEKKVMLQTPRSFNDARDEEVLARAFS